VEAVAPLPTALETGANLGPVGLLESETEVGELLLVGGEGVKHGLAIVLENLDPHRGVARGDAGGVAETVAGQVTPLAVFGGERAGEAGGGGLGQVADMRDDLVVAQGRDGDDGAAATSPEILQGLQRGGRRVGRRRDESDAVFEEGGGAVLPAGFLAAGHRMGADEDGSVGAGVGGGGGADRTFHAADVGDDRAGAKMRRDLAVELDDFVHRSGENDELRAGDRGLRGFGDFVDPGLRADGGADFRTTRPNRDGFGESARASGAGHGGAEQAGGEDGEMIDDHVVARRGKGATLVEPARFRLVEEGRRGSAGELLRTACAIAFYIAALLARLPLMLSHRARYRLSNTWQTLRPWLLTGVGLLALVGLWAFLATVGPGRAVVPVPDEPAKPDDPAIVKLTAEVAELEKQYQVYAAANIITDEAYAVLSAAVERQRALVRIAPRGDYTAQMDLERLQADLATFEAKRDTPRIEALQKDGEEAQADMRLEDATKAFREALELQNKINGSAAAARYKNFVRSTTLEQSLAQLAVLPIVREKEAALAKARAAVAEERWADALAGYISARDAQDRINREFTGSRYANLGEFDRLEAEIASLNAAGIAARIDETEKLGDSLQRAGDHAAAAKAFAEALALQQQINDRFSRSRFVSSPRIEALEIKLQTERSQPLAQELARLDKAITEELRHRRVVAAEQLLPKAIELTDKIAAEFPRSRSVDGDLRIKLNYLALKRADLRRLQDEVYDRLLPLIGVTDRLLLSSETPQALYQAVMNTNPSRNPGRLLPVDSVSWLDAEEFCTRLSWIMGTSVRLPTEAEMRTAHGEGGGEMRSSADGGRVGATDSGRPNRNGYRDILGNLAEWVVAPSDSDQAQVAGGSYLDTPEVLAKFPMETRPKTDRARHIGFRFVLSLPPDRA